MACKIAPRAVRASRARMLLRMLGATCAVMSSFSCVRFGELDPKAQRAADVFECYVAAVEPYLGGICDVADLVRDAVEGRASIPQALELLGASAEDLQEVDAALTECRGEPAPLAFREPPAGL